MKKELYKETGYPGIKQSQAKRMQIYFGNRDVKSIDTLDIEEFYKWCSEVHAGFPKPLSNNSIQKLHAQTSEGLICEPK